MSKNWLNEAIRRRVFRTAGLYIVGSWALIQFFDLLFEAWGLPGTALRYLFIAAVAGFPLALVFGWKYDITSKGIVRTEKADGEAPEKLGGFDYLVLSALIIVAGVVIYRTAGFTLQESELAENSGPATLASTVESTPDDNTVAVMPFMNMSDDPGNAYFSDGIAEELLNSLARVHGLGVTARTSTFALRDENLDIREIARRLTVANVVEGSVRKAGNRVRITAQLIRAEDGYHLWSETYDRDLDDIFAIQTEVAELIAGALLPQLGMEDRSRMSAGTTTNVEAQDEFLRGLALLPDRLPESLERAKLRFDRALELDPNYAQAHVQMSDIYAYMAFYAGYRWEDVIEGGLFHAQRAIELAPELGGGYSKLGFWMARQGMIEEAEQYYLKGIELDPSVADNHRAYGQYLRRDMGRFEEAVAYNRRAMELDPLSPIAHVNYGSALLYTGDPEGALRQYGMALELNPEFQTAYSSRAYALDALGRHGQKAWTLNRVFEINPESLNDQALLADTLVKLGLFERAEHHARLARTGNAAGVAYGALFVSLCMQSKVEESRQVLKEAREVSGDSMFMLWAELLCMDAENASDEAFSQWLDSLEIDFDNAPNEPDIELDRALYIAVVQDRIGRREDANATMTWVERQLSEQNINVSDWAPGNRVTIAAFREDWASIEEIMTSLMQTPAQHDAALSIMHFPGNWPARSRPEYQDVLNFLLERQQYYRDGFLANLETLRLEDWAE